MMERYLTNVRHIHKNFHRIMKIYFILFFAFQRALDISKIASVSCHHQSMSIFALSLKGHVKGYERKRNVEINLKWSFFLSR